MLNFPKRYFISFHFITNKKIYQEDNNFIRTKLLPSKGYLCDSYQLLDNNKINLFSTWASQPLSLNKEQAQRWLLSRCSNFNEVDREKTVSLSLSRPILLWRKCFLKVLKNNVLEPKLTVIRLIWRIRRMNEWIEKDLDIGVMVCFFVDEIL